MKSYTLDELRNIYEAKNFLPKERFVYYFMHRYDYSERKAREAHKLFFEFPRAIYDPTEIHKLDEVIIRVLDLVKSIQEANRHHYGLYYKAFAFRESPEQKRKVIYKDGEVQKELLVDFRKGEDIILFAEVLKKPTTEIVAILEFSCSVKIDNQSDKYLDIFEGDIFDTYDKYWGSKSNVYIATGLDTFKRLLYVKGKGYINSKKEPNYDEGSYTRYALTLETFSKIGNLLTDSYLLSDTEVITNQDGKEN